MKEPVRNNFISVAVFLLSGFFVIFLYFKLDALENPRRGFIDKIPLQESNYYLKYRGDRVGRLKTRTNIDATKGVLFHLDLLTTSPIKNPNDTHSFELVLFSNSINQVFNSTLTVKKNNHLDLSIKSAGITRLNSVIDYQDRQEERTLILSPVKLILESDDSLRIKYFDNAFFRTVRDFFTNFSIEKTNENLFDKELKEVTDSALELEKINLKMLDIKNLVAMLPVENDSNKQSN